jgi:hypothetical protein
MGRYPTLDVHDLQLRNQASDAGDCVLASATFSSAPIGDLARGKAAYRAFGKITLDYNRYYRLNI